MRKRQFWSCSSLPYSGFVGVGIVCVDPLIVNDVEVGTVQVAT